MPVEPRKGGQTSSGKTSGSPTAGITERLVQSIQAIRLEDLEVNIVPESMALRDVALVSTFEPDRLGLAFSELLEVLRHSAPRLDDDGRPLWRLNDDTRRAALARLGSRERMRGALRQIKIRPRDSLQRAFEGYIYGSAIPIEDQTLGQLADSLQAAKWLHGIIDGIPAPEGIQARIDRERVLAPLRSLVGTHFQGRVEELGLLSRWIRGQPVSTRSLVHHLLRKGPVPMLVTAEGGMGKSTLLARFILDQVREAPPETFAFAFIDFDRPGLVPEQPLTILAECARQVIAQFPWTAAMGDAMIRDWNDRIRRLTPPLSQDLKGRALKKYSQERRTELIELDRRLRGRFIADFAEFLTSSQRGGEGTFLLALDTFEEVQYRGDIYVEEFWAFLEAVTAAFPRTRALVCGRARIGHHDMEVHDLEGLEEGPAKALVQHMGIEDPALADLIAGKIGGNPLTLRLAVILVKLDDYRPASIHSVQTTNWLSRLSDQAIQRQLYDRILKHIHDEDVRKLAYPGLVLRRVTPDLILKVLAKPCGLTISTPAKATKLFKLMEREVALMNVEDDGSLRHRSDVRKIMLPGIHAELPKLADQIHRHAVTYYKDRTDVVSRAEEIYHRLALKQSSRTVDAIWIDGVEQYLSTAVQELPIRAQAYLLSRLGSGGVNSEIFADAAIEDWERYAAHRVRELVSLGRRDDAVLTLRQRAERSLASPLFETEARLLVLLGRHVDARDVAVRGIASALILASRDQVVAMLQLLAEVEASVGNVAESEELLDVARKVESKRQLPPLIAELSKRFQHESVRAKPLAHPNDPQKGQWGGKSRNGDWQITAELGRDDDDPDWFLVMIRVRMTNPRRTVKGKVVLHLHPDFDPDIEELKVDKKGEARWDAWVWGSFTVGVVCEGSVQLEYDLAQIPGAPKRFKNR